MPLWTPPADTERLPLFFYGTLQRGFANHANVVRGRYTAVQDAVVHGMTLRHFQVGFPGMYHAPTDASVVHGELFYVAEADYVSLMRDLDGLEGYEGPAEDNMYDRVVGTVTTMAPAEAHTLTLGAGGGAGAVPLATPTAAPGASVRAWMYLCRLPTETPGEPVPDGDWKGYVARHQVAVAADDWRDGVEKKASKEHPVITACTPASTTAAATTTPAHASGT